MKNYDLVANIFVKDDTGHPWEQIDFQEQADSFEEALAVGQARMNIRIGKTFEGKKVHRVVVKFAY